MAEVVNESLVEERRVSKTFTRHRTDYRYVWSNPSYVFMMQDVERRLLVLLAQHGVTSLNGRRILEIGCGTGNWLREFVKWGAHPRDVVGMDLLGERVSEAKALCAEGVRLFCGNATTLPVRTASFDLVAQFTVFTSVLDTDLKRQIASEMIRVIKPDGLILWYDFSFNNPKNLAVRGVSRKEIQQLFPGCSVGLRRITLAPPVTRRLASRSWLACSLLNAIPFLRTHVLAVIKKERVHLSR